MDNNALDMNRRKRINRRTFVKGSAIASSGLLLGSSSGFAAEKLWVAGGYGSDTLKLAVIGCGGRGTGAVRQALAADEGVELVAMVDAFRDNLDKCLETLNKAADPKRLNVKSRDA